MTSSDTITIKTNSNNVTPSYGYGWTPDCGRGQDQLEYQYRDRCHEGQPVAMGHKSDYQFDEKHLYEKRKSLQSLDITA